MFYLRRTVILGLLIGLFGIIISFIPFVNRLEENMDLSLLFTLRGPRQSPLEVVIINMDKCSADKLNVPDNPEKWPRSFHASLVENLIK
ncbi:MAG: CHASE2 domain-containing protein [wastewater metagenome]|nr:CHASE2 domain-containing protein [Candidatus Loosdrechtia aerotolerans]